MSKALAREEARRRLATLDARERAEADAAIAERVWEVREVAAARTLLLYAALPEEAGTDAIAREALRRGLQLAYPRSLGDGALSLHAVRSLEELRPGRYGIREPVAGRVVRAEEIQAALVPGLAWDRAGHRLGRGAGYYDRLLGEPAWAAFRCGLFFAVQEVPVLPRDDWDVRLDAVVTEREALHFGSPGPDGSR